MSTSTKKIVWNQGTEGYEYADGSEIDIADQSARDQIEAMENNEHEIRSMDAEEA